MAGGRRRDPYEVLGVEAGASPAEVTRAYRRRLRDLHPDSRPGGGADPAALREVLAAYRALHERRDSAAGASAGGIRIPVRRVAGAPPLLRAGPVHFHPGRSVPASPPTADPGSPDLGVLLHVFLRWW